MRSTVPGLIPGTRPGVYNGSSGAAPSCLRTRGDRPQDHRHHPLRPSGRCDCVDGFPRNGLRRSNVRGRPHRSPLMGPSARGRVRIPLPAQGSRPTGQRTSIAAARAAPGTCETPSSTYVAANAYLDAVITQSHTRGYVRDRVCACWSARSADSATKPGKSPL